MLVAACAGIAIIGASVWGLQRIVASAVNHTVALAITAALTIFIAFVFSVVLALGAAFLAAAAIAGDIESGIALAILPRPLSRAEYLLGKWIGLAALLALCAALFGSGELGAIALATGYEPPHPLGALAFLIAESLVLLTLALILSTRLPAIAAGLVAVLGFGSAWIAGIAGTIAASLHNDTVRHAATLISLLVPSDGLWRGALFYLEPVAFIAAANAAPTGSPNPFGASLPPAPAFVAWSCGWIIAVLAFAVLSFSRRDV